MGDTRRRERRARGGWHRGSRGERDRAPAGARGPPGRAVHAQERPRPAPLVVFALQTQGRGRQRGGQVGG